MLGSIGDLGGSPYLLGDLVEFAVDGGNGTPAALCIVPCLPECDEYESSSSKSRFL